MSRIVYVNGAYVPEADAKISVFNRGFLFADAVYEVTTVLGGRLVDFHAHMARLDRSLAELNLPAPASHDELLAIHRELVSRNGLDEGLIYMQVTRGAADRDFLFPPQDTAPSLVLFTQAMALRDKPSVRSGIRVASVPDLRWGRRDIKTVQLLYPSMAKTEAVRRGADDAWLIEDGFVTEGTSNNAHIVTADGTLVTRDLSHSILHGITRAAVLRLAADIQLRIEERAFTLDEAKAAKEAFITSASAFVLPVVSIDGAAVGDGAPGAITRQLREIYIAEAERTAI
ncbi:MAG TPA: D-amino-acid transaminase [Aurantimonas sp.]|jgi:D-alanine transaminase|nr:D-amino-acid transaminase [Aurantimonas sp.]